MQYQTSSSLFITMWQIKQGSSNPTSVCSWVLFVPWILASHTVHWGQSQSLNSWPPSSYSWSSSLLLCYHLQYSRCFVPETERLRRPGELSSLETSWMTPWTSDLPLLLNSSCNPSQDQGRLEGFVKQSSLICSNTVLLLHPFTTLGLGDLTLSLAILLRMRLRLELTISW